MVVPFFGIKGKILGVLVLIDRKSVQVYLDAKGLNSLFWCGFVFHAIAGFNVRLLISKNKVSE